MLGSLALLFAILPLRVAVGQADSVTIRGVVTDEIGPVPNATIRVAERSPAVHSDRLGEFRLVRMNRDDVRLRVSANGWLAKTVVVHPGRDSVVRILLNRDFTDLAPIYTDAPGWASTRDGVVVAFYRLAGDASAGDSVRVMLASKKIFRCGMGMDVARSAEPNRLSLRVAHIVIGSSCEGARSRGVWSTVIPAMSYFDEIVVTVNGVADGFRLRSGTSGPCVVSEPGPKATPLVAGPYPSKESRAWRDKQSVGMLFFPHERLPAC